MSAIIWPTKYFRTLLSFWEAAFLATWDSNALYITFSTWSNQVEQLEGRDSDPLSIYILDQDD